MADFTKSLRGTKAPPVKKKKEITPHNEQIIPKIYEISKNFGFEITPKKKSVQTLGKDLIVRINNDPLNPEINYDKNLQISQNKISLVKEKKNFQFQKFSLRDSQQNFYKNHIDSLLNQILNGVNVSIVSISDNNNGRGYSLLGDNVDDEINQGILPRMIKKLFNYLTSSINQDNSFQLKMSVGRINQKGINDMLNLNFPDYLIINELNNGDILIEGLREIYIENEEEFFFYLKFIKEKTTEFREKPVHYFYNFEFIQKFPFSEIKSKFNLYDIEEDINFNKVIDYLHSNQNIDNNFLIKIPYKDAILTQVMKNCFIGNFKTLFILHINPFAVDESKLLLADKINILSKYSEKTNYNKSLNEFLSKPEIYSNPISKIKQNTTGVGKKEDYQVMVMKIKALEEKISELENENSRLNKISNWEKLTEYIKTNFVQCLQEMNNTQEIFKRSIEKTYYDENLRLKEIITKIEKEALEETKGLTFEAGLDFVNFDCYSRIKILAHNLGGVIKTLAAEGNSYIMSSYVDLYENTLFIVNDVLRDFTLNKDIFTTAELKSKIEDQVTIKFSTYNYLKNSYSQLSILLIHYEKLLFDILNKMFIDLKNIQVHEKYSNSYNESIFNLNETVTQVVKLFDEFKSISVEENSKKKNLVELNQDSKDIINMFKNISKNRIVNLDSDKVKIRELEKEIATLKNENHMKSLHIINLTREIEEIRILKDNYEKSLLVFQNNNSIAFQQELENQVIAFNVLKKSFLEEINMAKNIVNGLSDLIDEFLINKDFYSLEKNRKMFANCYLAKAKSFLGETEERHQSKNKSIIYNIHQKFIIGNGTATKKSNFRLDTSRQTVDFTSGLNCTEATKGPMLRILKDNLKGDDANEVWAQDV